MPSSVVPVLRLKVRRRPGPALAKIKGQGEFIMNAHHLRLLHWSLTLLLAFFSACTPMRSADPLSDEDPLDSDTLDNFTNQFGSGNVADYQNAVNTLPDAKPSQPGTIEDDFDAYLEGPWVTSSGAPTGWTPSAQAKTIGDTLNATIKSVADPKMGQALSVFRDQIKAEIAKAKTVKSPQQQQQYQARIQGLLQKFMTSAFGGTAKKAKAQAQIKGNIGAIKSRITQIHRQMYPTIRR